MNNQVKTGVEWLPTLPNDWKIEKVKRIFYISKELSHKNNPTILSLARSGIKIRNISNNEGQLAESYDNYNFVKVGDLLLNPMDLYSGANCNVSYVEGVISPAYSNLRAKTKLEPKFFDFYFKVQYWTMAMFAHGKGVSFDNRWTLNADSLMNYEVPVPSFEEQKKIVFLLNRKIQQIDELISNQERQIEKLKEYRQAIITKAVTKGLNPNVPMKDSGVEWIGKMPNNWTRVKVNRLFSEIGSGTTPKGDSYYTDGFVNWIQSGDINGGDLFGCSTQVNDAAIEECSALKVYKAPYLIMAMYGGSVGHLSISHIDACCNQACCVMREPNCDFNFAFYSLTAAKEYLLKSAIGGGQPNISQTIIKQLWFCNPPIEVQNQIVEFLNQKRFEVDCLLKIKQKKIDSLNEYKKSLIYEYVTGEKRVSL